jgi:hypothetical protein
MKRLLSLVFVLGIFCAAPAHAMPVACFGLAETKLTIQVGGGCGIGGCTPIYVYGSGYVRGYSLGYYRGYCRGNYRASHNTYYPYVRYFPGDVIAVNKGVCGFGSYLSYNYGMCWQFCY